MIDKIMNRKKLVGIFGILIIISIAGIFLMKKRQSLPARQTISPDILYLTDPAHYFSGVVEKIEGNTILVSSPSSQQKKISFTVKISDKTTITRNPPDIPFSFITPKPPVEQKLTIKDIKIGENITVRTDEDLRTFSQNQFEATSITLPDRTKTLQGKITNVGTDRITMIAETNKKEYAVMLTADTEISYLLPPDPLDKDQIQKPVKLAISDLKKDMSVVVYTDVDLEKVQIFTTLRIEPILASFP
jgi:hypothetical protein